VSNATPTQLDSAVLAVLHRTGETWRAMAVDTRAARPSIVGTREFPADQHGRIDAWLDEHKVSQVLCVLPASCVICRNCALPDASPEQLDQALHLQAEAHLLGMVPSHRLAMAVLPGATGETSRNGLILAWPESSEFTAPVNGARPVHYVPDIAAIAALLNGSRPAEPMLWLDRADGSVALALTHAAGALFRGTHEDPKDTSTWQNAIGRMIAETSLSVGHSGAFIDATVRDARHHAAQVGPKRSAFFAPTETIAAAAAGAHGASTDTSWWSQWGVALGALLARTGPLSTLTRMLSAPPIEKPSPIKSIVTELSRPRTAARLAIACVLLLAFGPLLIAALRLAVLNIRFGNVADDLRAVKTYKNQLDMYRELDRQQAWPMTKLLSDIASNTPEGIELDVIKIESGATFNVSGLTRAHGGRSATEVVALMQEQLRSTGIFSDIVLNWGEGNNMGVYKFDLSAKVAHAYRPFDYDIERDFGVWTLAMRQAGRKPPTDGAEEQPEATAVAEAPAVDSDAAAPDMEDEDVEISSIPDESEEGGDPGLQSGRRISRPSATVRFGGEANTVDQRTDAAIPPSMDIPGPISPEQIKTMATEEAKAAIFKIARVEKYVKDEKEVERLKTERRLLIDRLRELRQQTPQ
jgi:hypothetical protein